jgi:hypothetical protein
MTLTCACGNSLWEIVKKDTKVLVCSSCHKEAAVFILTDPKKDQDLKWVANSQAQ